MKMPAFLESAEVAARSAVKPLLARMENHLEDGRYQAQVVGAKFLLRVYPGHALAVTPENEAGRLWANRAVSDGHFRWIVDGAVLGAPVAAAAPPATDGSSDSNAQA